jgi:hypothetical protein
MNFISVLLQTLLNLRLEIVGFVVFVSYFVTLSESRLYSSNWDIQLVHIVLASVIHSYT